MRILLVGSGGREHALAWKLRQSPLVERLIIAPGNPGTAEEGQNMPIAADDIPGLARFRRGTDIPLATGEHEYTCYGVRDLILGEAADINSANMNVLANQFIFEACLK